MGTSHINTSIIWDSIDSFQRQFAPLASCFQLIFVVPHSAKIIKTRKLLASINGRENKWNALHGFQQKEAKQFVQHPTLLQAQDNKLIARFSCQIQIRDCYLAIPAALGSRRPHFACLVNWLFQKNLAFHVSLQLQIGLLASNFEALGATGKEYKMHKTLHLYHRLGTR